MLPLNVYIKSRGNITSSSCGNLENIFADKKGIPDATCNSNKQHLFFLINDCATFILVDVDKNALFNPYFNCSPDSTSTPLYNINSSFDVCE